MISSHIFCMLGVRPSRVCRRPENTGSNRFVMSGPSGIFKFARHKSQWSVSGRYSLATPGQPRLLSQWQTIILVLGVWWMGQPVYWGKKTLHIVGFGFGFVGID
jgi:hypothetical protein